MTSMQTSASGRGIAQLLRVACAAIVLAGNGAGVSAVSPPGDEPQRGVEYLAIIYPVPGQCFPSAEGVVLSMALAPHVYSRWPRDKDAGELYFALQQGRQTVCEDAACVAPGP
jgi:hypothetical protein